MMSAPSRLYGFIADAEMPYFACFRKPTSTSLVLTYPVPPFTTIIGMVANALGYSRPNYFEGIAKLQEVLWLNLRPLTPVQRPSRELAKILKLVGEAREQRKPTSFPSSPMYKYFLVRPTFRLFVASEDNDTVMEIVEALRHPNRPLYFGQSDDMVTVEVKWQGEVLPTQSDQAWALPIGAREGTHQPVELLRLPLAFAHERQVVYSPLLSLPADFPFRLPHPEPMWCFGEEGETVHLICVREEVRNATVGEARRG
jgi:CRISPR-associated protein Cas5h